MGLFTTAYYIFTIPTHWHFLEINFKEVTHSAMANNLIFLAVLTAGTINCRVKVVKPYLYMTDRTMSQLNNFL